ncbi:hypothetical protein RhiJN_01227 [Ceratobasidium sp. AG-Ba]|nr:hypothetical protein RhiJN_01227 [Ceratobasidium sp. AG-Ba]
MTHNRNMDIMQLCDCAEAAQHIEEIYACNPDLNKPTYRLSHDGTTGVDRMSPASWKGVVTASSVGIRSSWMAGQMRAVEIFQRAGVTPNYNKEQLILNQNSQNLNQASDLTIDMMRPFGQYIGIHVDSIEIEVPNIESSLLQGAAAEPINQIPEFSAQDVNIEELLPPPHAHGKKLPSDKYGWMDIKGKPVHLESVVCCSLGLDGGIKPTDRLRRVMGCHVHHTSITSVLIVEYLALIS